MKIRQNLTSLLIFIMCLILTGCANLSYTGQDYDASKVSTIQTPEGFYFSTYKKTSNDNVDISMGITKTTIDAAMVIYIGIKNNTEYDYKIYKNDFVFKNAEGRAIYIIPASAYVNAYQSDQTGAYAGAQALAPTFNQFAQINNNFQQIDSVNSVTREQIQRNDLGRQISQATENIIKKSMNTSETIKSGEGKWFYLFIERPDEFPISAKFKDLTFTFGSNKRDKARVFDD